MKESWYDIKGYLGLYQISSRLIVRSAKTGRKLIAREGTKYVQLHKNGNKKTIRLKEIYNKMRVL